MWQRWYIRLVKGFFPWQWLFMDNYMQCIWFLGTCRDFTSAECTTVCASSNRKGELFTNTTGCEWRYSCNCISCQSPAVSIESCTSTCQADGKVIAEGQCTDQCCTSCNCVCGRFESGICDDECKTKDKVRESGALDEFGCDVCKCVMEEDTAGEDDESGKYFSLNLLNNAPKIYPYRY